MVLMMAGASGAWLGARELLKSSPTFKNTLTMTTPELITWSCGSCALVGLCGLRFSNPGVVQVGNQYEGDPKEPGLPRCPYCPGSPVKSPGTHHCRDCGSCVAGHDHHCLVVGRCVGVNNRWRFMGTVAAVSVAFDAVAWMAVSDERYKLGSRRSVQEVLQDRALVAVTVATATFFSWFAVLNVALFTRGDTIREWLARRVKTESVCERYGCVWLPDMFHWVFGHTDKSLGS
eukprot:TRINITY_DN3149_c0_g1_i4.p1 TRINITY_DN3149_c0_g1~~TRINITY_DN3149_c0_g1_i4.p1  ORF type:complete len:232 (-),score=32.15 TRINITY_DN3149_c0_g1_i4:179-874(-)